MQQVLSRRAFLKAAAPGTDGAAQAAPVELQWWSFALGLPSDLYPHGQWEQDMADKYMQEHPDVQIAYQAMGWDALTKMATAVSAGNPPNLILRGGVDQILYALEGDVALEVELPQEFLDDLPAGWYDGMLYQGKNYMVPFYTLANGMTINLDIIEGADAMDLVPAAPERTWSFDDYLELMKACTFERDDGSQVWGAVFSTQQSNPFFYWPEQVLSWNWGTDTVELKDSQWRCKLGDEEGLAWLQWMQDLHFVHNVVPNPSGLSANRWEFWNQNALLGGIGPSIGWARRPGMEVDPETLVVTDTEHGIDWIFVQPPTNPGVDHSSYWGGPLLDVNIVLFRAGDEATIQPSIDFSLWLTNAENQKW
ncbi:extracellular solute-binding protein, partial [Chloroflexi bacterium TSY]|nr:extracellular solute-binding protein [Chloroflexi bacterium TSY]